MNVLKVYVFVLLGCFVASSSLADIYEWADEKGVKHYSNFAPPTGAKVLMKTKEVPYDEAADRARMEAERQERLAADRLELAQREAELELREADVERRIAAADRLTKEALREADDYWDADRYDRRIIYRGGGYGCHDNYYGCNYPAHDRWYYRKKYQSSHYKRQRYKGRSTFNDTAPYRRYRYGPKHHGSKKYGYGKTYHHKTRHRNIRTFNSHRLKSHRSGRYGASRVGSTGGRYSGWGSIGRGRSGFGMRP